MSPHAPESGGVTTAASAPDFAEDAEASAPATTVDGGGCAEETFADAPGGGSAGGEAALGALRVAAAQLGFSALGVAAPDAPQGETLRRWLQEGCHAGMSWMERHLEARLNPQLVLPGVRSVVMLMPTEKVSAVVTDQVPAECRASLEAAGVELILA